MRTSAVEEGVEVSYREVKGLVDQLLSPPPSIEQHKHVS